MRLYSEHNGRDAEQTNLKIKDKWRECIRAKKSTVNLRQLINNNKCKIQYRDQLEEQKKKNRREY